MKPLHLILAIILVFAFSGGTSTIHSATPPAPVMVNIKTCPSENAYLFDGQQFWHMSGGTVSRYYNKMTMGEFLREVGTQNSPYDMNKCPPANGHMRSRSGGELNIPMGFFDNEDDWLTDEEFQELKK